MFSSLFPLGCLVVAISSAPASAASVRDVYASCVCRRRERRSLLSECAALSPRPLPFRPSPPSPFLGSWCLTQTCAFDTHTQTDDTGEGRSVMCDEWPPGRRDGISGARPLSSPPSPEGPLLGEPSPRPWDPDRRESAEALNPLGPALQRRGRATDAQDLLTIPPLHPSPRFLCRAVFFFFSTYHVLFFFFLLERVTD